MDCTQCRGLVEQSCPPNLGRQIRMLEAASGQLYPASTEATRFVLTGAHWLAWHSHSWLLLLNFLLLQENKKMHLYERICGSASEYDVLEFTQRIIKQDSVIYSKSIIWIYAEWWLWVQLFWPKKIIMTECFWHSYLTKRAAFPSPRVM